MARLGRAFPAHHHNFTPFIVPYGIFGTSDSDSGSGVDDESRYVRLPGVAGNSLTVPDAANLEITGDLDLRFYGSLDDWTPAGDDPVLINKIGSGSAGYMLHLDYNGANSGKLLFRWYDSGGTIHEEESTAKPTVADHSLLWVRATLTVNDGAGHYLVKFYTSSDGITWVQLGSTVTGASTTSIKAGNASLTIGEYSSFTQRFPMNVRRVQIYNGIAGTLVLDIDTSVATSTSFTALTGQTVTINGSSVSLLGPLPSVSSTGPETASGAEAVVNVVLGDRLRLIDCGGAR
jgi:hypothetical protein